MKRRRLLLLFLTVVVVFVATGSMWLRVQRQQYARNRQLIAALERNDTDQALVLINSGADPNTHVNPPPVPSLKQLLQQFLHQQPLPVADSPTAFLLVCGVPGSLSEDGSTGRVTFRDVFPLAQAMLLHGAEVNAITTEKETGLQNAVIFYHANTVKLLLGHGAKVNAQDSFGKTALMLALIFDNQENAKVLLAHGAEVNLQDYAGHSALHEAVSDYASRSLIRQLLAHGANPNLPNAFGETPITEAQKQKDFYLVALLRRKQ